MENRAFSVPKDIGESLINIHNFCMEMYNKRYNEGCKECPLCSKVTGTCFLRLATPDNWMIEQEPMYTLTYR